MSVLGKRIKYLREKNNYSQKRVADALGISNVQLSRYESGDRKPDPDMIVEISKFFDVPTDYLLGRSDQQSNEINDAKEMIEFFNNPNLNLFFKEMKEAPEDQLEEMRQIWEVIKKRGLNK
jgi:transcriptional regulator with XRE-family HTH domain